MSDSSALMLGIISLRDGIGCMAKSELLDEKI